MTLPKSRDTFLLEPNGYYIQIKEWHRAACPGNDCASALLAFLLFFHKHKQTMKEYARLTNEMLKKKGRPAIADETDWQFHTDDMLIRKLFYWKQDTIRKAIAYLKDDLRFIETDAPNYLQTLYKTGRTKWFLCLIPNIQKWIYDNYPLIENEATEILTLSPMERKYKKTDETLATAKRLFKFRQLLHNEPESIPDKPRLAKITARLKEGKDEIDLAFAIIGNKVSAWHSGMNPNGNGDQLMTYHLIRHIFKDAEQIETFKITAGNFGWTRAKVIDEYERLLNIQFEGRSSAEVVESSETIESKLHKDRIYREAAKLLTELVIHQQKKMETILVEISNQSDTLPFTLVDISDPARLGQAIIDCLSETDIVQDDRKARIHSFTVNFIKRLKGQ